MLNGIVEEHRQHGTKSAIHRASAWSSLADRARLSRCPVRMAEVAEVVDERPTLCCRAEAAGVTCPWRMSTTR